MSRFTLLNELPSAKRGKQKSVLPSRPEVHRMGQERSVGMVAAVASVCASLVFFSEEYATVRASIGNC